MNMPTEIATALLAGPKIDRRGFLTFAAKGLALAFVLPVAGRIGDADAAPTPKDHANAFIRIGTDGTITLTFGGAEMGQGSMSGLPQILAEELMVDWTQITVEQSLVNPLVSYTTGGSSAVSRRYATLRNAGAAARELLIAAAMAANGDGDRDHYRAESARVIYTPTGGWWPYSALAEAAATQPLPADLRLTDPGKFRLSASRCRGWTFPPRSTAARSTASTRACRTWCTR
jgi:isoquinoline 1-oxidoreductase beta subunit